MNLFRRNSALHKRDEANELSNQRPHPRHFSNGDELKFRHDADTAAKHGTGTPPLQVEKKPAFLMSYTKGLPHNFETGLLQDPDHYTYFIRAIDSGDPRDFRDTPLGFIDNMGNAVSCQTSVDDWVSLKGKKGKLNASASDPNNPVAVRAWESQGAGSTFDLQGPDAQSVTMPPAPKLGSAELIGEMGEVYTQALLRDVPFNAFSAGSLNTQLRDILCMKQGDFKRVNQNARRLTELEWFSGKPIAGLSPEAIARRRSHLIAGNAYRGITPGDEIGPYLSQFLLVGNTGINGNDPCQSPAAGLITYGAIRIDQRVRTASPKDYLTNWEEWYDAQNGADFRGLEQYETTQKHRFIYTPRDLATYVHYDALYEAYLNACLILLAAGTPFDPGIPFQNCDNRDHQQGFAHFGGPHILSLVTEVATRALKAVRFQKFNIHRRLRPEALAARIYKHQVLEPIAPGLKNMKEELERVNILTAIDTANGGGGNYLLPMAFCEGSPMHPSYGAGHATVAAACVTILKAFFDHKRYLCIVPPSEIPAYGNQISSSYGYVSTNNGEELKAVPVFNQEGEQVHLTVEGELNKLASNISIGRDWAGVHYFTDYYESIRMGEQIALGILEEQKLTYGENFSMTVPLFDGTSIRI